ncbi:MAG TPA: MFS transporter [Bacteroidia bacterium]|nr:MFS transporter [Bacteroidia bacterium]
MNHKALKNPFNLIVIVAALGYFVDIYDLLLFSIIRIPSLKALGVSNADLLNVGASLLSWQMGGMLIGGIIWGILGDKKGRLSVLFGSIILYSIANIANGFVTTIPMYAAMRFLAGLGLAGELGAGITLVTETMTKEHRGYGTTVVSSVGIMGAIAGYFVANFFKNWQIAYFVGGGMGLLLLILRIGAYESGMFSDIKIKKIRKGNFRDLFSSRKKIIKYISVILVAIPVWYVVGILITFCSEIGKDLGMGQIPSPGTSVLFCYAGIVVGGTICGLVSQYWESRVKAIALFMILTLFFIILYYVWAKTSLFAFYTVAVGLGIATGYWTTFMTSAAEQFGTNIRATVTTTAPNFVRGAVVPMTIGFRYFKTLFLHQGALKSSIVVGIIVLLIAFIALLNMEETYHKDLDYLED